MDPPNTTLLDAKAAFLRQQVRLLSQPLSPSKSWRDFAPATDAGPLSDKTVDAVMVKINQKLKEHNKNVFAAQTQRHIAEQIDLLYWNAVSAEDAQADADAIAINKDTDLTKMETVEGLPMELQELAVHPEAEMSSEEAERYAVLRARLVDAVRTRDQQRKRLEGYRQLSKMLEPLENATENVQPNLATRDGELKNELERMRVLLARAQNKVGEMSASKEKGESMRLGDGMSEKQRLQAAMDLT